MTEPAHTGRGDTWHESHYSREADRIQTRLKQIEREEHMATKTASQTRKEAAATDGERVLTLPLPKLPTPKADERLLYYGAIGGLALVGIVEWPVAVVVGTTYALLSRNKQRTKS